MQLYIFCTPFFMFRYKFYRLLVALISMMLGLYAWENDLNVVHTVSVINLRSIIVLVVYILVYFSINNSAISILYHSAWLCFFYYLFCWTKCRKSTKHVKENFSIYPFVYFLVTGKHVSIWSCRSIPIILLVLYSMTHFGFEVG